MASDLRRRQEAVAKAPVTFAPLKGEEVCARKCVQQPLPGLGLSGLSLASSWI